MLPTVLSLKHILKNWKKEVDRLNSMAVSKTHLRKVDGATIEVTRRRKAVNGSVFQTGKTIILHYIRAYENSYKLGIDLEPGQLPELYTNGALMGKECKLEPRTIRNHIKKLEAVGLLVKKFHGSRHDYSLWITPQFLFEKATCDQFLQLQKDLATPLQRNNFPHNVSCFLPTNEEKENRKVDKGVAAQQCDLPKGEVIAGNTLATQINGNTEAQLTPAADARAPKSPVAAKKQDTEAGGAADLEKMQQQAVFVAYVENFWKVAKAVIYPRLRFDAEQERQAKIAIWKGVFYSFDPKGIAKMTSKEWEEYHQQAIERLQLAGAYYEKHQDKYAPMPYAVYTAGTGYFEAENKYGFAQTTTWWERKQVWKKQNKVQEALRTAQRQITLHKAGKLEKLPARLKAKTELELFKFHENKIRPLGINALNKFYAIHSINQ